MKTSWMREAKQKQLTFLSLTLSLLIWRVFQVYIVIFQIPNTILLFGQPLDMLKILIFRKNQIIQCNSYSF